MMSSDSAKKSLIFQHSLTCALTGHTLVFTVALMSSFLLMGLPHLVSIFTLTHYVDANLYHDMITGRSVTGILHLVNKTPIDWYSKKQATIEIATYGCELIAAQIGVDLH